MMRAMIQLQSQKSQIQEPRLVVVQIAKRKARSESGNEVAYMYKIAIGEDCGRREMVDRGGKAQCTNGRSDVGAVRAQRLPCMYGVWDVEMSRRPVLPVSGYLYRQP